MEYSHSYGEVFTAVTTILLGIDTSYRLYKKVNSYINKEADKSTNTSIEDKENMWINPRILIQRIQ